MELELTSRQRELVDIKNDINDHTVEKYRLAGQVAQTALTYIIELIRRTPSGTKSIGEVCRAGDLFLQRATATAFKRSVKEKGIALPVHILKGSFVGGVAPEVADEFQGGLIHDGDLLKISLGVHIDGYTAQVAHSIVVAHVAPDNAPLEGTEADAMIAAYLATEAVVALISMTLNANMHPLVTAQGQVTGTRLRALVETVAENFRVQVAPGSRIRRVRRFLAGQSDVVQEIDFKGVVWNEEEELERVQRRTAPGETEEWEDERAGDDFVVLPGEVWLADISMAATGGERGALMSRELIDSASSTKHRPAVFSRDFTVSYGLKLSSARSLLSRADAALSVYPFKLSFLAEDEAELKSLRMGLNELVQHHIFVAEPITTLDFVPLSAFGKGAVAARRAARSGVPVAVAREMATVVLVPGTKSHSGYGEAIRLTGGHKVAPPSWLHSKYEVADEQVKTLLTILEDKKASGLSFQIVQASKVPEELFSSETAEMEID